MLLSSTLLNIKSQRSSTPLAFLERNQSAVADQCLQTEVFYHELNLLSRLPRKIMRENQKGGLLMEKQYKPAPEGKHYIFRKWIHRNGKIVYASEYGLQAFAILVDD